MAGLDREAGTDGVGGLEGEEPEAGLVHALALPVTGRQRLEACARREPVRERLGSPVEEGADDEPIVDAHGQQLAHGRARGRR